MQENMMKSCPAVFGFCVELPLAQLVNLSCCDCSFSHSLILSGISLIHKCTAKRHGRPIPHAVCFHSEKKILKHCLIYFYNR